MVKLLMIRDVVADSVRQFLAGKDQGASLLEYALLASFIAAACVVTLGLLGTQLATKFQAIVSALGG